MRMAAVKQFYNERKRIEAETEAAAREAAAQRQLKEMELEEERRAIEGVDESGEGATIDI